MPLLRGLSARVYLKEKNRQNQCGCARLETCQIAVLNNGKNRKFVIDSKTFQYTRLGYSNCMYHNQSRDIK